MENNFWVKVEQCNHENLSPFYLSGGRCDTPYCTVYEYHCLDCGVYISECGCGTNCGLDGWSWHRRQNWNIRKYGR
ncbi:hypothetical protein M0R04_16020 [Candidatus Dojkabacteria bacterium]|jgi:hypothetical protein|nr:hypothetical protein [Candidatus Dojkabacteria bacterium]